MRYSKLATRIDLPISRAWEIHYDAARRRARGEDVIILSIGDHEFDTPAGTVDAAVASLRTGRHHYTPSAGEPHLRQAVVEYHRRITGQEVGIDHIVIFPGAQCGLFVAGLCLFDPGDEVIVPEPMYTTYEGTLRASGAIVRRVPLRPERGFRLDPADLAAALGPATRGLLLNSPHNPTGAMLTVEILEQVASLAVEHDLWVLSDEVYATMTYEAPHVSPVAIASLTERTVVIGSMSKSHAMTGWRIGWVVARPEHAVHFQELGNYVLFGVSPFVQDAAAAALGDVSIPAGITRRYRQRRDLVCAQLAQVPGLRFHRPEGAMYLMLDIRDTGLTDFEFAGSLLDHHGVAVLPGSGFGADGAGHVRLSLSAEEADLTRACERIRTFVDALLSAGPGIRASA